MLSRLQYASNVARAGNAFTPKTPPHFKEALSRPSGPEQEHGGE